MKPLQQIPLFASLDDETLSYLESIAITRRYTKGAILFFEGETPDSLVILTQGILKLYKTSAQHKEVVLHRFTPVSLIAEVALLQQIPYPATALFETDGSVMMIDYKAFAAHFFSNPELARVLILSLSQKIRMLEGLIDRTLIMDATERICDLIENRPELFESMRHFEIAALLNITPETLSRTLKKLIADGIVEKTEQRYCLTAFRPLSRDQ
jgi:CRP/FNR family transcriptional regulator